MVNWLWGLLIKQPEEQEVVQDDTASVMHAFIYLFIIITY